MTRTSLTESFIRDWASHLCETDESRVMMASELRALVDKGYDDGLRDGRAELRIEIEQMIEGMAK